MTIIKKGHCQSVNLAVKMFPSYIVFVLCSAVCQSIAVFNVEVDIFSNEAHEDSIDDIPIDKVRLPRQANLTPNCLFTQTVYQNTNICPNKVLFWDDFDDLDSDRWRPEVKFADNPDYEFVFYNNDNTNMYVSNGQLHIKPTLTEDKYGSGFVISPNGLDLGSNCTGTSGSAECKQKPAAYFILPPVISARLNSKPFFSFLYGRVDVRAKLPKGNWIYPELFLTPTNFEYGAEDYNSGEIRIAFLPGNNGLSNDLQGSILLSSNENFRHLGVKTLRSETPYNDDFHVYSVLWEPNGVTFLVDDKSYGSISPSGIGPSNIRGLNPTVYAKWKAGNKMAPLDREMSITLGVGVGGHSFSDSLQGKPYNNYDGKAQYKFYRTKNTWYPTWSEESKMIIDYVKAYSLDEKAENRCSVCKKPAFG